LGIRERRRKHLKIRKTETTEDSKRKKHLRLETETTEDSETRT
jgi:hypothetical protein